MSDFGRTITGVSLYIAILLTVTSACGYEKIPSLNSEKGESIEIPLSPINTEDRTVTVLIDKDTPVSTIKRTSEAIEQELNIKTDIQTRANGSQGENMLKSRIAAGDMTDIFLYNTGALLYILNPAENLMDLSNESYCTYIQEDFKESATVDGKLYAVPASASRIATVWTYNMEIYQNLGLDVPSTWDELMDNCEKIKQSGVIPIIGSYKDEWTSQFIFLGDEFNVKASAPNFPQDLTANKAKYSATPSALRSFEKMWDVSKYLNSDALSVASDDAIDMLVEGKGAHYPIMSVLLYRLSRYSKEESDNIGVFRQPGDDPNSQGMTVWLPNGWFVFKDSPNTELARQWLELHMELNINNSNSSVAPDAPYAASQLHEFFNAGDTSLAIEYESPLKGQDCIQICLEVLTGITDPESAAADYDKDIEKQAVQLNLPGW